MFVTTTESIISTTSTVATTQSGLSIRVEYITLEGGTTVTWLEIQSLIERSAYRTFVRHFDADWNRKQRRISISRHVAVQEIIDYLDLHVQKPAAAFAPFQRGGAARTAP
jgi:phosphatidylserine/phosphatidylglycerophosphate/cardiolipin synthase-like enzyme